MKALRILLVCRDSVRSREGRMVGAWSYPVPEFTWDTYCVPKTFTLDLAAFDGQYDLVMHEDTKAWGAFEGNRRKLPVCYIVRDSTLSDDHYENRVKQSRNQADLVLVDWDRLERFACTHKPVRRFSHCANERLFHPIEEKTVDVAFHAAVKRCHEREVLREWLGEVCRERGWSYASGIRVGHEYPKALAAAKIVINLERTPTTRAHRVFDALACRSCLLTSPEPEVSGEHRVAGEHYLEFKDTAEIPDILARLLNTGEWRDYADAGYELVMRRHTWAVRAKELYRTLLEVFPWLG